jgi:hypothetical protein
MSTSSKPSPFGDLVSNHQLQKEFKRTRRSILRWITVEIIPKPIKIGSILYWVFLKSCGSFLGVSGAWKRASD